MYFLSPTTTSMNSSKRTTLNKKGINFSNDKRIHWSRKCCRGLTGCAILPDQYFGVEDLCKTSDQTQRSTSRLRVEKNGRRKKHEGLLYSRRIKSTNFSFKWVSLTTALNEIPPPFLIFTSKGKKGKKMRKEKNEGEQQKNLEVDVGRATVEPDAHVFKLFFQQRPSENKVISH